MKHWKIDGYKVVVTGASKGIGEAITREFLTHGATVLMVARDLEGLAATQSAFAEEGLTASNIFSADLSAHGGVNAVIDWINSHWGRLDVMVNNVGMNIRKPLLSYSVREIDQILHTNLYSAV